MLSHRVLSYIIDCTRIFNSNSKSNASKVDSIEVLTLYLFIKRWFDLSRSYDNKVYRRFDSLSSRVGMSKSTAIRYCQLLAKWRLIELKIGNYGREKATEYNISEAWKEKPWRGDVLEYIYLLPDEKTTVEYKKQRDNFVPIPAQYIPSDDEAFYLSDFKAIQKNANAMEYATVDWTKADDSAVIEVMNALRKHLEKIERCIYVRGIPESDLTVLLKAKETILAYVPRIDYEIRVRKLVLEDGLREAR